MIPNSNEIRVYCRAYECDWTPGAMRQAYEAIVSAWTVAEFPPDRLVSQQTPIRGRGEKWGTFSRKRKRLEQTGFDDIQSFSLSRLCEPNQDYPTSKDLYPDRDWVVYARVVRTWLELEIGWIPSLIGNPSIAFFDLFKELTTLGRAQHAVSFKERVNPRNLLKDPVDHNDKTSRDWHINGQEWAPWKPEQEGCLLLRNVHLRNYLSDAHLDAPFGKSGMSLREWIDADPAERGVLCRYTDTLTEWTPPPGNIPEIRERLFRAGRVFYHRLFKELDYDRNVLPSGEIVPRDYFWKNKIIMPGPFVYPPEPFYRPDIRAPWESPEPIPEVFRADYYRELCADVYVGLVLE